MRAIVRGKNRGTTYNTNSRPRLVNRLSVVMLLLSMQCAAHANDEPIENAAELNDMARQVNKLSALIQQNRKER